MEEIGSFCVNPDTHKKYAPVIVADERGAKNDIRFFSAARSLQSRSYATGGARYLQADLMLLTHAGCAFKDPRGRFGISAPGLRSARNKAQRQGNEISENQSWRRPDVPHFFCKIRIHFLQVRTAALRSNRRYGAAALLHCGAKVPLKRYPLQENAYLYRSTRRVRCS